MDMASPGFGYTLLNFLIVLTPIVFVHEFGHYITGRMFGIKVEVFSIGFGRSLFHWHDRAGTRWQISLLPFGGYVKFFGDRGVASQAGEGLDEMTAAERAVSFHHKPVWQRAIVVAAGPLINLLLAVVIYAGLFSTLGQAVAPARVEVVATPSPASDAGLLPGDQVIAIDGKSMRRFDDIRQYVMIRPNREVEMLIERDGQRLNLPVRLAKLEQEDRFGNRYEIGRLGVESATPQIITLSPLAAVGAAVDQTIQVMDTMASTLADMVLGMRSLKELGGPILIAKMSGEQASLGMIQLISFIALISVNLGFVNLLPIPMLDGGHIAFYAFEALRGRPLGFKVQEVATIAGLALVLTLFLFLTINDMARFGFWGRLSQIFS